MLVQTDMNRTEEKSFEKFLKAASSSGQNNMVNLSVTYFHPDLEIYLADRTLPAETDLCLNMHYHDDFEWCRVLEGTVYFRILRKTIAVSAGETLFINSKVPHCFCGTKDCGSHYEIMLGKPHAVSSGFLNDEIDGLVHDDRFPFHVAQPVSQVYSEDLEQMLKLSEQKPPEYEFEVAACWLKMLRQIIRIQKNEDAASEPIRNHDMDVLREMLSFIGENYSSDLDLDEIARAGRISRSKCTKIFRAILNISPSEFVQRYRLKQAAGLIANTDLRISEISSSCGFNQQSYFNRVFLRQFGITPLEMRKQYRSMDSARRADFADDVADNQQDADR